MPRRACQRIVAPERQTRRPSLIKRWVIEIYGIVHAKAFVDQPARTGNLANPGTSSCRTVPGGVQGQESSAGIAGRGSEGRLDFHSRQVLAPDTGDVRPPKPTCLFGVRVTSNPVGVREDSRSRFARLRCRRGSTAQPDPLPYRLMSSRATPDKCYRGIEANHLFTAVLTRSEASQAFQFPLA